MPNLGYRGAESHGRFDVSSKNSAWDMMHEWVHCSDKAANHQLPVAVAFWITWRISTEECSSLMQNLMQIHNSTLLVILNAMTTQYTCSLSSVYCPHWLVQWSCHCSCLYIPVRSPWLPGYIIVMQTVPIILAMTGLFLASYMMKYLGMKCTPDYNLFWKKRKMNQWMDRKMDKWIHVWKNK